MTVEDTSNNTTNSEETQNEEKGFIYFIKACIKGSIIAFIIMSTFMYMATIGDSHTTFIETFKENISGFIGLLIIVFVICALISFTEPADYMHVKIKLDALERNKDQLRRIVQDVVNEETKDNNSIDKEKVKKITTTLIAESLILDDEKK